MRVPSEKAAAYAAENTEAEESPKYAPSSDQPPLYEDLIQEVNIAEDDFNASAKILVDGRININIDRNERRLSTLFVPAYEDHLRRIHAEKQRHGHQPPSALTSPPLSSAPAPPSLNIVLHVVGSRGDVQPFIALGQHLKRTFQHRIRLATHGIFRDFVEAAGLEFFNLGGDPAALMAFMVSNPSLVPSVEAIRGGVVGARRREMAGIMEGCWRACFEAGDGMEGPAGAGRARGKREFVADAIIANPPSFAHIHCAQKLGIPLHLMFTMPWSATSAFPHPLANIQPSNVDTSLKNFISYPIVEMMMWQGLGGTINAFRSKILDLEPVRILMGPRGVSKLKIPYSYLWSPSLIPKPEDWGNHIAVTGFSFLPLASQYVPDRGLEEFLSAKPTPIYVGFGSIVVDDPKALLELIFDAVRRSGQRAVVSSGWGGLHTESVPEGIFMIGNVPHDWLFAHVSCVVHHGGAGTTATGISLGKPTVVVPFFGDQFFWGSRVARAGAGPKPVPFRELKSSKLAAAIENALSPTVRRAAQELGRNIQGENGAETSALNFHQQLNVDEIRCSLDPSRTAVWKVRRSKLKISAFSATVLIDAGLLRFKDLSLHRSSEYDLEGGPWDPVTGTISACLDLVGKIMMGFADMPLEIRKARKPKAFQGPKDSKPSPTSDGTTSGHQSTSSNCTLVSSNALDDNLAKANTSSSNSFSLSDIDSQSLHTFPDSSRIGVAGPSNPAKPEDSIPSGPSTKSDGRILRTSGAVVVGFSKGIGRILIAGFNSPFEVSLSAARGFHNFPKLYGDDTVRTPDRITGVWTGLKAAGKGLTYGIYDGVSGIWTQPIEGAKKEGVLGACKGAGKGLLGVGFKPAAGVWGILGYTYEGFNKEIQKLIWPNVQKHIITSRKTQGFEEFRTASAEEKARVIERWRTISALM